MSDKNMIPVDRPEFCIYCNQVTTHNWRVNRDLTYKRCTRCGREHTAKYEKATMQAMLDQDETNRGLIILEDQLNKLAGDVINHKWSANQPAKDRGFVAHILEAIFGIKGTVTKLRK